MISAMFIYNFNNEVPSAMFILDPVMCAVGFRFQLTSMNFVKSCIWAATQNEITQYVMNKVHITQHEIHTAISYWPTANI